MKTYATLSLGELIEKLRTLGDAPVCGLNGDIHSDRGFYERNATTPCEKVTSAERLADKYQSKIGKTMHGWKGGCYYIRSDFPVYYADFGDCGPMIVGLERDPAGVYEPVLLEDTW